MLKIDTEFWKPDQQNHLFSDDEKYIRTIVMRFYKGTNTLNNIWREVYPLVNESGATTLDEVSLNDLRCL